MEPYDPEMDRPVHHDSGLVGCSPVGTAPIYGMLRALDEFRRLDPDPTVQVVQAFLSVALWEGTSFQDLAGRLDVSASTISRNMRLLGQHGRGKKEGLRLVAFHEDPKDLRFKIAKLTPKGREVLARMVEALKGR
jgi:DNA-binding MarR family transcriptional regulator